MELLLFVWLFGAAIFFIPFIYLYWNFGDIPGTKLVRMVLCTVMTLGATALWPIYFMLFIVNLDKIVN
jgi:hypothetical protein